MGLKREIGYRIAGCRVTSRLQRWGSRWCRALGFHGDGPWRHAWVAPAMWGKKAGGRHTSETWGGSGESRVRRSRRVALEGPSYGASALGVGLLHFDVQTFAGRIPCIMHRSVPCLLRGAPNTFTADHVVGQPCPSSIRGMLQLRWLCGVSDFSYFGSVLSALAVWGAGVV